MLRGSAQRHAELVGGGGGGGMSHEMTERKGEEGIHSRALSERLPYAKHGLGTGDTVGNRADPAAPLQDWVSPGA